MSKVSRSVYQKVCEENKKLLRDIEVLVSEGFSIEYLDIVTHYQDKFEKEKQFRKLMKKAAEQYIKDNKDTLPEFLTKTIKS